MKPSENFCQKLCEKYQLTPKQILFCDDKEDAIVELDRQGFETLQYSDVSGFKEKLIHLELL